MLYKTAVTNAGFFRVGFLSNFLSPAAPYHNLSQVRDFRKKLGVLYLPKYNTISHIANCMWIA